MNTLPNTRRSQSGISLVELMISLTLSLILAAGATQIFIGSKQAYTLQDATAILQENGRFALDILKRNIRIAGFPSAPGASMDAFVAATTSDGDNDTITVQAATASDCLGAATPTISGVQTAINRFFVNTNGSLACEGNGNPGNPQPLVDDVQNMQILYGVDTDGTFTANRYITATAVAAASDWDNVVSVRMGLLLKSNPDDQVEQSLTFPSATTNPGLAMFDTDNDGDLELFDTSDSGTAPDTNVAQDKRIYRFFTATTAVRNRAP